MSTYSYGHVYLASDDGGEVPRVTIAWYPNHGKESKGNYEITISSGDRLGNRMSIVLGPRQLLPFLDNLNIEASKAIDDYSHSAGRDVYA